MNQHPLSQLTIRSAVVRGLDIGNILACDLKKEEEDVPHVYIFKWQSGSFFESSARWFMASGLLFSIPIIALETPRAFIKILVPTNISSPFSSINQRSDVR